MNEKKLYHFLMTHETGIKKHKNDTIEAWVHVAYNELKEFIDIIEPEYENYPKAQLQESSMVVDITEILGDDLADYQECFNTDDWSMAFYEMFCEKSYIDSSLLSGDTDRRFCKITNNLCFYDPSTKNLCKIYKNHK